MSLEEIKDTLDVMDFHVLLHSEMKITHSFMRGNKSKHRNSERIKWRSQ